MKKIINTKVIKILLLILSLTLISSLPRLFINSNYKPLPEVKLNPIVDKEKAMAIMISNDGTNYQEYKSDTWPGDNYKFKEAKCIDNNGILVDENIISFENGKVTLTTNKTIYCTIYFDYKGTINILRENDPNKILSSAEVGGMYRYQGVGVSSAVDATHKLVDNNYICFGTNNKSACLNDQEKYMYRIIGITKDGELKLIKMQPIEENDNKLFQWWSDATTNIEWPDSLLFKRLNGLSKSEVPGDLGNTDIFINSTRYEYMKENSEWYNLVEDHNWMYGDVASQISSTTLSGKTVYGVDNNGLIIYDIEIGVKLTQTYDKSKKVFILHQWSEDKSINAKIGLMYLHDYILAYDNTRSWWDDPNSNNWIYINNNNNTSNMVGEWFMVRSGTNASTNYSVYYPRQGAIGSSAFLKTGLDIATRPVFYVNNDIQISGSGSKDNPFIINF